MLTCVLSSCLITHVQACASSTKEHVPVHVRMTNMSAGCATGTLQTCCDESAHQRDELLALVQ